MPGWLGAVRTRGASNDWPLDVGVGGEQLGEHCVVGSGSPGSQGGSGEEQLPLGPPVQGGVPGRTRHPRALSPTFPCNVHKM